MHCITVDRVNKISLIHHANHIISRPYNGMLFLIFKKSIDDGNFFVSIITILQMTDKFFWMTF